MSADRRHLTRLLLGAAVVLAACGGGGSDGRDIEANVREDGQNLVTASGTTCRFDGDRQVMGEGVVRNRGETPHHVNISVRFVDTDGVRMEISSDSVSDLEPGESARWSVSVYVDNADDVAGCEGSVEAS